MSRYLPSYRPKATTWAQREILLRIWNAPNCVLTKREILSRLTRIVSEKGQMTVIQKRRYASRPFNSLKRKALIREIKLNGKKFYALTRKGLRELTKYYWIYKHSDSLIFKARMKRVSNLIGRMDAEEDIKFIKKFLEYCKEHFLKE